MGACTTAKKNINNKHQNYSANSTPDENKKVEYKGDDK